MELKLARSPGSPLRERRREQKAATKLSRWIRLAVAPRTSGGTKSCHPASPWTRSFDALAQATDRISNPRAVGSSLEFQVIIKRGRLRAIFT
jgi:hypothetical protein